MTLLAHRIDRLLAVRSVATPSGHDGAQLTMLSTLDTTTSIRTLHDRAWHRCFLTIFIHSSPFSLGLLRDTARRWTCPSRPDQGVGAQRDEASASGSGHRGAVDDVVRRSIGTSVVRDDESNSQRLQIVGCPDRHELSRW